jgi:hypothetical protein
VADRVRGGHDYRCSRDGLSLLESSPDAEGNGRRAHCVRRAERDTARKMGCTVYREMGRRSGVLWIQAVSIRHGMEFPVRHSAPPRPDFNVLATHGVNSTTDLRPKRRRAVADLARITTVPLCEGVCRILSHAMEEPWDIQDARGMVHVRHVHSSRRLGRESVTPGEPSRRNQFRPNVSVEADRFSVQVMSLLAKIRIALPDVKMLALPAA